LNVNLSLSGFKVKYKCNYCITRTYQIQIPCTIRSACILPRTLYCSHCPWHRNIPATSIHRKPQLY